MRGSRKHWDPHDEFSEVARQIRSFIGRHSEGKEAYQFNIKIPQLDVPRGVYKVASEDLINDVIRYEMEDRLNIFASQLVYSYPWITSWVQAGRQGGWLVLDTNQPVLSPNWEVVSILDAKKRLKDLQSIRKLIQAAIYNLVHDLESKHFWRLRIPAYQGGSRKSWDPRES